GREAYPVTRPRTDLALCDTPADVPVRDALPLTHSRHRGARDDQETRVARPLPAGKRDVARRSLLRVLARRVFPGTPFRVPVASGAGALDGAAASARATRPA